jgi:mRNA interferase RelE/StbE
MAFQISISPKADKAFDKLPEKYKPRVSRALDSIQDKPFSGQSLLGDKKGQYSVRVWPYRIIYIIEKKKLVILVIDIDHRSQVYKN